MAGGTAARLGYRALAPRRWQRPLTALAATRAGSWLLSRTIRHVDRLLGRGSTHRYSVPGLFTGLPVIHLTTTGARTGLPRTTALVPVVVGGDLAVLGTNFGGASTPGWVFNLLADPAAVVAFAGRSVPVVARPAGPDERALIWALAARTYAGFEAYPRRAAHREVQVFVLETVD